MDTLFCLLSLLCGVASAQNSSNSSTEFPLDPYLQYRPPFSRSLPVQILLTGVILTLVAVLFIHLIFTAQYHWPLAPVNYVLQLSGVTTLLISLIATIHVVLSAAWAESEKWPYMLSYIAVNVPPVDLDLNTDLWGVAERATWLVMNASTSGLIQITHIQFLTLLYPSRLEGRLIFTLLGPLAVVAAIMQLLPISGSTQANSIASAVRNVCNATLSLLFTISLFIWGFLVNRQQAWRTDGGTAAFGCAALSLALVSTALNFLYVHKEDEFVWLPGLMWAVVLWQSFLGWWWWVGAGSGSGLVGEDQLREKLRREAKRESRRRKAKDRRASSKDTSKNLWKGVTKAFGHREGSTSAQSRLLTDTRSHSSDPAPLVPPNSSVSQSAPSATHSGAAHSTTSDFTLTSLATIPRALPAFMRRWYASLRREHVAAARQQAAERVERLRELERNGAVDPRSQASGWGLGSFGWRLGREERSRSRNVGQQHLNQSQKHHDLELYEKSEWRRKRIPNDGDEGEDYEGHGIHGEYPVPSAGPTIPPLPRHPAEKPGSLWWWGPLWRWRLKDSTVY
ncbi:uncharacterized protein LACBIDRAFT_296354 [Laccaria bicolor S238N-H82]|uniref:Predicted protein n=1 Tax=Laccaria bicolor (strain S238N-H82 / ATCC MYA-4686) TaxID=486041 RepID=B0D8K7_LACBS|nr:uncharacterized protein LACBIDRAFT_296354 [Laccaria bicolor S238N-H82]EDR09089.1 predicted protein [Laccaria bicolor S238N-H82]|eukprot:XP_001880402.1 predicted protein [Laccaria bicolor S238N-H82]